MSAGIFGMGGRHDLTALRGASRMGASDRLRVQIRRDELLTELDALDEELAAKAAIRREMVSELKALRDWLWPRVAKAHARRPPVHGRLPLPPIAPHAHPISGRALRHLVGAILADRGPMTLEEIHSAIHLAGYVVAAENSVKTLADAMRYELRRGRVVRVRRATYRVADQSPRRGRRRPPRAKAPWDPIIAWDPSEWPSSGQEAEAHPPAGIVDVEIDEHDRLPGPDKNAATGDRHHHGGAHEGGEDVH